MKYRILAAAKQKAWISIKSQNVNSHIYVKQPLESVSAPLKGKKEQAFQTVRSRNSLVKNAWYNVSASQAEIDISGHLTTNVSSKNPVINYFQGGPYVGPMQVSSRLQVKHISAAFFTAEEAKNLNPKIPTLSQTHKIWHIKLWLIYFQYQKQLSLEMSSGSFFVHKTGRPQTKPISCFEWYTHGLAT